MEAMISQTKRRRRYPPSLGLKNLVFLASSIAILLRCPAPAYAQQFPQPDNTVVCTNSPGIEGYETIAAMNADMAAELARIVGGGNQPDEPYVMKLCPFTTFDASVDRLNPILNRISFICGDGEPTQTDCVFDLGEEHVRIEDSTEFPYVIEEVTFQGITFQGFTIRAIEARAKDPTKLTLIDCIFQDFRSEEVLRLRNPNEDQPMDVEMIGVSVFVSENSSVSTSSEIREFQFWNDRAAPILTHLHLYHTPHTYISYLQSSEQRPLRAQATTVFQNSGGLIVARNLLVQYLQVTDVFLTNENGMTMISDSTFTQGRWAVRYITYSLCLVNLSNVKRLLLSSLLLSSDSSEHHEY